MAVRRRSALLACVVLLLSVVGVQTSSQRRAGAYAEGGVGLLDATDLSAGSAVYSATPAFALPAVTPASGAIFIAEDFLPAAATPVGGPVIVAAVAAYGTYKLIQWAWSDSHQPPPSLNPNPCEPYSVPVCVQVGSDFSSADQVQAWVENGGDCYPDWTPVCFIAYEHTMWKLRSGSVVRSPDAYQSGHKGGPQVIGATADCVQSGRDCTGAVPLTTTWNTPRGDYQWKDYGATEDGEVAQQCVVPGQPANTVTEEFPITESPGVVQTFPVLDCPQGSHRAGFTVTDLSTGEPIASSSDPASTDPNGTFNGCTYHVLDTGCSVAPDADDSSICHWGPYTVDAQDCHNAGDPAPEPRPATFPDGSAVPSTLPNPPPAQATFNQTPGTPGTPDPDGPPIVQLVADRDAVDSFAPTATLTASVGGTVQSAGRLAIYDSEGNAIETCSTPTCSATVTPTQGVSTTYTAQAIDTNDNSYANTATTTLHIASNEETVKDRILDAASSLDPQVAQSAARRCLALAAAAASPATLCQTDAIFLPGADAGTSPGDAAAHDWNALTIGQHTRDVTPHPEWFQLTYKFPGWDRGWLTSRSYPNNDCALSVVGDTKDCDEYPFASAEEGGSSHATSTLLMDPDPNQKEGVALSAMYRDTECGQNGTAQMVNGDPYVVVPLVLSPNDVPAGTPPSFHVCGQPEPAG